MKRLIFSTFLLTISLSATTINVPADQASIQAGIDAAVDGDTVLVQPGTYVENINFSGKNIVVGSLFLTTQDTSYISQTVIDGNQSGSVVTIATGENPSAALCGLKIINGNGDTGGGIRCDSSSPTLSYLYVSNNYAGGGGGINTGSASPTLKNITVMNNESNNGGGIVVGNNGSPIILNCVIKSNSSVYDGGGLYFSSNTSNSITENVLIYENICSGRGGGVWFSQTSPTIVNATIVNNNAAYGAGIYSYNNSVPTLVNSIVWDASAVDEIVQIHETASMNFTHSNILGGWSGEGNFASNPQFVDDNNRDFKLSKSSPCIGAGLDTIIVPSSDIEGNSRPTPAGSNPDIGAYENSRALPHNSFINVSTSGDDNSCIGLELAPFATVQAAVVYSESGDTILVHPGTYVENINFSGKSIVVGSLFLTTRDTSYISQTIIDGNQNGNVVTFENGEGSATVLSGFSITNGYGVGAYYEQSGGGINCRNSSPTLDNLNVHNNSTGYYGGGIYIDESSPILSNLVVSNNSSSSNGGGICITGTLNNSSSSPIISNVEIINNSAGNDGGGMSVFHGSNPTISNVVFSGNTGIHGGGIQLQDSSPTFTNILIINNTANHPTSPAGGGIYCNGSSSPTLVNCTIGGNTASYGGGIYGSNLTVSLNNSIVSGNSPNEIYFPEGDIVASYSNILGGWEGTGNIDSDPLFRDALNGDYRLSDYSPCIGAGATTIAPTADIDGNPRPNPSGSNPDIGAFENPLGTATHIPITINVPGDYSTIQAGLNAVDSTDTVLVQPGTYTENIFWPETNGIKLMSAGDSSNTIIDGGGVGRVIYMNPQTTTIDTTTLIQGFKITNGGNVVNGGGIFLKNSHPKLDLMLVQNNSTTYVGGSGSGGGLYLENSNPIINRIAVKGNEAGRSGGGMYLTNSNPIMENVDIISNNAYGLGWGGGLMLEDHSNAILSNVNIHENITGSFGQGAGISIHSSNPSLTNVNIYENITGYSGRGGGMYLQSSNPILNRINIYKNVAHQDGGGMLIYVSAPAIYDVKIFDNLADENGGGININSSGTTLDGCSVMDNISAKGGGIYVSWGGLEIKQSNIINNHSSQEGNGIFHSSGTLEIDSCNITNYGNSIYNNDNSNYVTATYNWFGNISGPYHPIQNQSGQGDSTNAWVNVTPWLTEPNTEAPPLPTQNVSVSGTGNDFINLEWDPSPLGDFAGFKLYYDSDESGYPYENSMDVGSETSHSLSGLNLGTEYFLAVTVYDTDGNESWYSQEVSGVTRVMEVQNLDIAGDENRQHLITHDPLITFDYFDSMGESQTDYQLQISTDSTFQGGTVWESGDVISDATAVRYTEGFLENGVTYYLRAKVASGVFWSDWSNISFRMNSAPSSPELLSPENGGIVVIQPTLRFLKSHDAEEDAIAYSVYLYNTETMITPLDSLVGHTGMTDTIGWTVSVALDDNAQHWWKVKSFDGYEYNTLTEVRTFLFNISNDEPSPFELIAPIDENEVASLNPLLSWHSATDVDPVDTVSYVLYLDTPAPGVETFAIGTDTSYQVVTNLLDNTNYSWKVIASDLNGGSTENTGSYQSFRVNTENDLPTAFNLLAPEDESMVVDLTPTLVWQPSSDPDDSIFRQKEVRPIRIGPTRTTSSIREITAYQVYLDVDSLFTETVTIEVLEPEYTPSTDLLENMVYHWKIEAVDDVGGTLFSEHYSFWTNVENEAPAEFSLLLPTEDAMLTDLTPTFTWEPSSDPDLEDGLAYNLILWSDPDDMDTLWSGESTTLTLDSELEDNQTYYWTVYAEDWSGLVTFNTGAHQSFTVNMGNDNPSVVDLVTPDSVMVLSLFPEMFWTKSSDPDPDDLVSYKVHWWSDALDIDSTLIDTNAMTLPRELEDNTQYFWEVTSMDQTDGISYSEEATFWTDLVPEAPSAYALLSPANRVEGLLPNVVFEWEVAADPDPFDYATYRIEITTDSTFNDITIESNTGIEPGLTIGEDLLNDTEYWWRVIAIDTDSLTTESEIFKFTVGYVAVAEELAIPIEYVLDQNFPNPFNPSTTLRYGLPEAGPVSLVIYDIRGNTVKTIGSGAQTAGWYEHTWNGMDDTGQPVSTGLYLTRLQAGSYSKVIKMLYLK